MHARAYWMVALVTVFFVRLTAYQMPTTAATTTAISRVCGACGTIKASGKMSCCGRGGSWFGKCGSADNVNLGHTWHEGIWVCKAQPKAVAGHQHPNAFQEKDSTFSGGGDMGMDSEITVLAAHMSASTFANTTIAMTGAMAITLPFETPVMTSDRNSRVHDAGTLTSKVVAASISTNAHARAQVSTPKPSMPSANSQNIPRANEASAPSSNGATVSPAMASSVKLVHSTLAGQSTARSPRESDGAVITARGLNGLSCVVATAGAVLAMHCWWIG